MSDQVREYGLYIDGKSTDGASESWVDSTDPSNGELVARVAKAGRKDARRAVEAARRAFDQSGWASMTVEARCQMLRPVVDVLEQRAADLTELEARDAGMTIRFATATHIGAVIHARELMDRAERIPPTEPLPHNEFPLPSQNLLLREPYGVVSALTPFNDPLGLAVWKVFPALAMGNTVVLKGSPQTPCSISELALAFSQSDVPPGVFNVIPGGDAETGEELVTNPMVDRVAFTGSTEVGRQIMALAAQTVKKVTLELGGKSPVIVLDDADMDLAVTGALMAMYLHSGQVCQAGSRLFVPRSRHDEMIERLVAAAAQFRVGPTLSWETDLGPVINARQLERIDKYVAMGRADGATLVTGGHRLTEGGLDAGHYFAPTIFTDVDNDSRIAQEEIFGPVLCVLPYDEVDAAVRMANGSIYGLAGSVWSTDVPRAMAIARRLQAGTVWINEHHLIASSTPYGGYKQSGIGKEMGDEGILEYVQSKHVWVDQGRTPASKVTAPLIGLDRILDIEYE